MKDLFFSIKIKIFDQLYLNKLFFMKIKNYLFLFLKLKRMGFINIQGFQYKKWRNGYCYFIAYQNKQKVFIKIDTKLKLLSNEIIFYDLLYDKLSKYMVKKIDFFENEKIQILILEYIKSRELREDDLINHPVYIKDIFNILKTINKERVIHRDIKLDNFLILNNTLKIIDFTFSNSFEEIKGFKELDIQNRYHYSLLQGLGNKLNPKDFIWNDFYSMRRILEIILENNLKLETNRKEAIIKSIKLFYTYSKNNNYQINL